MSKNQKSYTNEFKEQMVEMYKTGKYSLTQLGSEYGISKSTLSGWIKNLTPIKVSETETISVKEFKALQKEMERLRIENEILKKATAIFAKEQ